MVDITTTYAGLKLKNPVVAASSGLTATLEKVQKLVENGVGAIVLKSLFEEQIEMQGQSMMETADYPEAADYIAEYVKSEEITKYLDLIKSIKAACDVPVIASINCFRADAWTDFAKNIEAAGADAIELNVMRLETDLFAASDNFESQYIEIVKSIASQVKIPVTVKLSSHISNIPALVDKLRASGAKGVVLFNRSYRTDVNIENECLTSGKIFTTEADLHDSLRYIGLCSAAIKNISYCASTGVHSAESAIKAILVGADAVQMCSALYKEGPEFVSKVLKGIEDWMQRKGYQSVDEFKGRLNASDIKSATMFERMQFMKYFSKSK